MIRTRIWDWWRQWSRQPLPVKRNLNLRDWDEADWTNLIVGFDGMRAGGAQTLLDVGKLPMFELNLREETCKTHKTSSSTSSAP